MTSPRTKELGALLSLAAPLAAMQVGDHLLGVVDTAIVGRLNPVELGAVGLGNSVFATLMLLGLGLLLGLDPLISQALGAGEKERAHTMLWQGGWLALFITLPLILLMVGVAHLLPHLGIADTTAAPARGYVYMRALGLWPFLFFTACRSFLQADSITRPLVWSTVWANILNVPVSWVLVLGDEGLKQVGLPTIGLPAMGAMGAGLTSAICTYAKLFVIAGVVYRNRGSGPGIERRPSRLRLGEIFSVGWPLGIQLTAEIGIFAISSVLIAGMGEIPLAAHQVALSLAALSFMAPLGFASATAVRVGLAIGHRDRRWTRDAGFLGIGVGVVWSLGTATCFLLFAEELARLMTNQEAVIQPAAALLRIAAVFQLSDAVQVVAAGALRGAGATRWPLWANLGGHYLIALPVGVHFAFGKGLGAPGIWWGLCAGLTAVGIVLTGRFERLSRTLIERV